MKYRPCLPGSLSVALALLATLGSGCGSSLARRPTATPPVAPAVQPVGVSAKAEVPPGGEQSLYRLTYDSGEGRTSLKAVLRQEGPDGRFQLVFSDVAGRRVWSLDHRPREAILVDHRSGTFCRSGPDLRLPEVHPQELPLSAVPRVLAGRLPMDGKTEIVGDEIVDSAGRRWRTKSQEGELVAWSLLDAGGPALWWARDRDGGLLSRRGGVQYRWRLIVREALSEPLANIVPEGSEEGVCGD